MYVHNIASPQIDNYINICLSFSAQIIKIEPTYISLPHTHKKK